MRKIVHLRTLSSGIVCAEQATKMIWEAATFQLGSVGVAGAAADAATRCPLSCYSTTDLKPAPQQAVIGQSDSSLMPKHVFNNILDVVPASVHAQPQRLSVEEAHRTPALLQAAQQRNPGCKLGSLTRKAAKCFIDAGLTVLDASNELSTRAYCVRCDQLCALEPPAPLDPRLLFWFGGRGLHVRGLQHQSPSSAVHPFIGHPFRGLSLPCSEDAAAHPGARAHSTLPGRLTLSSDQKSSPARVQAVSASLFGVSSPAWVLAGGFSILPWIVQHDSGWWIQLRSLDSLWVAWFLCWLVCFAK